MKKKISISLPEHVYRLALKRSRLSHGEKGFSSYICEILSREFTDEELRNEMKPASSGKTIKAGYDSICYVCRKQISIGDDICYTDLGFQNETMNWVHSSCCRSR